MHEKVVVDASVWVSSLRIQDINHDASRRWLEKYIAQNGLLIAPFFLLLEVAAAISRRTGNSSLAQEAVNTLTATHSIQFIPMDSPLIQAALEVAANLQLRAGDAIYVAIARKMNIPLISWDKEQLQKAGLYTQTYTPDEYVFDEEPPEEEAQEPS